jgi:hypothetical protein
VQGSYSWTRQWRTLKTDQASSDDVLETFESIDRFPALVLLGAPGLGKTHEVRRAYDELIAQGLFADFISLRRITRPDDLKEEIERSLTYKRWRATQEGHWTILRRDLSH